MNKTIEDELEDKGVIIQTTVGRSMEPMLYQRRTLVEIVKSQGNLKKYDVVLYKTPSEKYVLHRVIKVRSQDYVIRGDNLLHREYVPSQWILGVVRRFYRHGKWISAENKGYCCYARLWCLLFPFRAGVKLFYSRILGEIVRALRRADRKQR